jgi:hypothetical protein
MGRELAELKDDANHWLTDPEYAALSCLPAPRS